MEHADDDISYLCEQGVWRCASMYVDKRVVQSILAFGPKDMIGQIFVWSYAFHRWNKCNVIKVRPA